MIQTRLSRAKHREMVLCIFIGTSKMAGLSTSTEVTVIGSCMQVKMKDLILQDPFIVDYGVFSFYCQ